MMDFPMTDSYVYLHVWMVFVKCLVCFHCLTVTSVASLKDRYMASLCASLAQKPATEIVTSCLKFVVQKTALSARSVGSYT
ncbi:hypothetical protein VNO80_08223 [Phaseolus coccineus]|uniref:Uncharacterized protein n=1 Tax=Phaseolus coccineus TaxID=3886 RepID=A0AAN9NQM5_PHACN